MAQHAYIHELRDEETGMVRYEVMAVTAATKIATLYHESEAKALQTLLNGGTVGEAPAPVAVPARGSGRPGAAGAATPEKPKRTRAKAPAGVAKTESRAEPQAAQPAEAATEQVHEVPVSPVVESGESIDVSA
ncbi:MAG TPA: hypothetical protein VMA36_19700 [Candidatus Limnocylindria bacterium]|jgi:hypothetical protein|nr:hypothetical protein [Candidatus Limnocylindria bacterium]